MGHKASKDTGIFYSGKTAKGCIHGPFFRRVPLAGFELAVSRHVRFTMWRTRNLVAPGAGLVVDSSCLSPWVGEPVTPAGGYHTSVDVWLTGTYHA